MVHIKTTVTATGIVHPDSANLVECLPIVRGCYTTQVSLARMTWFQTGGRAEVMFRPDDLEDLSSFLAASSAGVPVTVIGVGSNLLVRDGGVPGVVIRLGRDFTNITVMEGVYIHCGAAALDSSVAAAAAASGIGGLEFLSGIPGTIGGTLRMNAGAYGAEISDFLVEALAVNRQGQQQHIGAEFFSYRQASIAKDWIFTSAILRGYPDNPVSITTRISEIRHLREEAQPLRTRTSGSIFKNPSGTCKRLAWELIDCAGCRGLQLGRAMISEKHCNFLINTGGATSTELETLGEEVRRRVHEIAGIDLEWEICRIGQSLCNLNLPRVEEI